jgi:hypothetical protein
VTAPVDLVASMVLDSGARWGECATDDQWADMEALLSPDGPRRHFWLRARGRSKTFDSGAALLAMMLAGGLRPGDELYAAAAGREQAGHLARKIRLIAAATPELEGAVEVQNFRVITPRTGAVLDVVSSDLSTAWGKTPRWVFIDEIANHDTTDTARSFIEALLTSLPKRRDSVLLAATTPSSPNHWARGLWDTALEDPLWRCSIVAGPAPWQDPAELEGERRRLTPSLWRRLFLCEWAELDDQLATMEQVRACIGHEGILPPDPQHAYVHGADLSYARDMTAVASCHVDVRGGREILVLDRMASWRPAKGRQIPLGEVANYTSDRVREYGGLIHADPYQGMIAIQEWRAAGHQVKAATFSPMENSRRASLLLSLIRERQLDLPADQPELFHEITSLRLAEGSTPGVLKLTTDGSTEGHYDRCMALMLCAQELMTRPAGSWLGAYGTVLCDECHSAYADHHEQCPRCHPRARATHDRDAPGTADAGAVSAGGWMAAYGAKVCNAGHAYVPRKGRDGCPRCRPGAGGQRGFPQIPRVPGGV